MERRDSDASSQVTVVAGGDPAAAAHPRSQPDPLVGTTLGHFRIMELLGRGGMGVVYRAVDERLQRIVALKVLPPHFAADADRRERFLREARNAAAVSHPNIATVHEVGEDQGQIYIAMEFVEGQTLRHKIDGDLPLAGVLGLAVQIARGLARAHEKGVLHRDLKPDNVMVGSDGEVKLLDFGLAKRVLDAGESPRGAQGGDGEEVPQRTPMDGGATVIRPGPRAMAGSWSGADGSVTNAGLIMGTPGYMSPEQALGNEVDHRADIFSLGVVLYEMVAGDRPFAGSPMEELAAMTREIPKPPSTWNKAAPPELDRLILRCLKRRPEDRYGSVRDLCSELERIAGAAELPVRSSDGAASGLTAAAAGPVVASTLSSARPPALPSSVAGATAVRLPSGRVTLLLADIAGSTRILEELGDRYPETLARYHELLQRAVAASGGCVVDITGDSLLGAFAAAGQAVLAAIATQRALHAEPWPGGVMPRVRMGLHTGEPRVMNDRYVGLDVHRVARIGAAAHGGQVLLSAATWEVVKREELPGAEVKDLGLHRLKDLRYPEHLFELSIAGVPSYPAPIYTLTNRPNNLPEQPTAFVGREAQLEDVLGLLRQGDTRMVTLTGPGGTGKTRLSIEVARALLGEFPAGVLQVQLASIIDPALVPASLAQTLGVPEAPGKSMLESLKSYVDAKRLLLLLDNFEQVVAAAPAIAELLGHCPGLKLLVTSREPLKIRFEREYPVPPLMLPRADAPPNVESLAACESARLFIARVRDVRPEFQVTQGNAALVASICARLDGLPLAIELAASRMKMLTLQSLHERLGDRLGFLKGGPRDLDERHQTLRAAIDWSYNLLDEPGKVLLRRVAVFVGGFAIESAEEVCGFGAAGRFDVFDELASLTDKSLLTRGEVDGEPRIGLLETIREYALAQLRGTPDYEVVRARHAAHMVALVEGLAPGIMGREQRRYVGRMVTETDNIRAALGWALEQASAETTSRLLGNLLWFWIMQGRMTEGRAWAARAVAQAQALGQTRTREHAVALHVAAWLAVSSGDFAAAHRFGEESMAIWRALGRAVEGAHTQIAWGLTSAAAGRIPEGPELVAEARDLCRGNGDAFGAALALNVLGEMYRAMGDYDAARASYEEALGLLQTIDDIVFHGFVTLNLVHCYLHGGDWRTAARMLVEPLTLGQEFNYPIHTIYSLASMACVAVLRGLHAEGLRLFGAFDALNRSLGAVVQPADQVTFERYLAVARAALPPGEAEAAWQQGARWSRDQAIAATLPLRD
ncbi:MAG TPA: protein kinase [Polyangia bacterium]|nr:protein kinase [Polyangia bacterium]